MRVVRFDGDEFTGSCPFHCDCLEGLASGIAIGQRAGRPGATVAEEDPLWESVVDAIAQACANLRLTLACERIAARTQELIGGYLPMASQMVVAAELGEDAGPKGALLLAAQALAATNV